MFYGLENTQQEISFVIENLIEKGDFPYSVLFSGPEYSSRMYAANCVARKFCADFDSTIIISDRNHLYRINAALKLFKTARNKASKIFLKETLGVFLKQFHGALLDSQGASKKKKFSDAFNCIDLLSQIDTVGENYFDSFASKIEKSINDIVQVKTTGLSIDNVRAIKDWSSTSSLDGKSKVIIIEGLENSSVSASNALLKILEEPPTQTFFILISSQSGRLPSTILSRIRKFNFKPFSADETKYVLNSLFLNTSEFPDLKSFFIKYSGINVDMIKNGADAVANSKAFDLPKLVTELEKTYSWDIFFEFLLESLRLNCFSSQSFYGRYNTLVKDINQSILNAKAFNQNKRLVFDYIIYRIREVLK